MGAVRKITMGGRGNANGEALDRLESMSAFVAVAKARGFSAAARELGVPLATINRRVVNLERDMDVRLLQRTTRQVVLSDIGQHFFVTCERILEELRETEEAATGEYRTPKGVLTITAPMGFGRLYLQPIALEFLAAFSDIDLKLLLADRMVHVIEENIDLALRISELPDSSLIARPLGKPCVRLSLLSCATRRSYWRTD